MMAIEPASLAVKPSGAQYHQFRVCYQVGKVGHCAYPKEYQGRVDAELYALVQVIHYGAFFFGVNAYGFGSGNISKHYAETYREQQQRFEPFVDGQQYVTEAYQYHYDIAIVKISECRGSQKVLYASYRLLPQGAGYGCLRFYNAVGQRGNSPYGKQRNNYY